MVQFCLEDKPKPCFGISLVADVNIPERVKVQSKKGNISKAQREWIYHEGVLSPFLYNNTYVAIDVNKYLVIVKGGLPPVIFTNVPFFRSESGLCVVPMKCNRNELGFCSKTSDERATHLANGAMLKLLPCLKSTVEWTIVTTLAPTTEYEHPLGTEIPTSSSLTPTSSASYAPSFMSTVSPSFSPTALEISNTSLPSVSPTFSPLDVSPTSSPSFVNQTIIVVVSKSEVNSYVGLSAIAIIFAIIVVVFLNWRKRIIVIK